MPNPNSPVLTSIEQSIEQNPFGETDTTGTGGTGNLPSNVFLLVDTDGNIIVDADGNVWVEVR